MVEYTNTYVKQAMNQADEFAGNNNFDSAVEVLSKAKTELPDNNTLSAKLSQVEADKKKYDLSIKKEQILKEAEEAFNSQGYESALSLLQSVSELSSDPDINEKISEYKEYEPVSVFNLIELNRDELKNWANSLVDTFNNDYTGAGRVFSLLTSANGLAFNYDEHTWYTENKYTHLKGKCAVHEDFKGEAELMVYGGKEGYHGDNSNLLYKIKVDRSTKPFDIE